MADYNIGSGGDYTTVAAWESAMGSGDHNGLLISNVTDSSQVVMSNSTPSSLTLKPDSGSNKHDGTPGSGRTWTISDTSSPSVDVAGTTFNIEDLVIDGNGGARSTSFFRTSGGITFTIQRCIIHNVANSTNNNCNALLSTGGGSFNCWNNIICNITNDGNGAIEGLRHAATGTSLIYNNTVSYIKQLKANKNATGIYCVDDADTTIKNNLVNDVTGTGIAIDYDPSSFSNATSANNVSEDTSSPDGSSYQSKSCTFASAGSPNWDYKLISSDDAVDLGADLGNILAAIDIIDYNRDTGDVTWDAGAHEYVPVTEPLVAAIDGTGLVAADIKRTRSLVAAIDGSATVAANLTEKTFLATAIDGTATVAANVERTRSLATAIDGSATVAADVERTRSLATAIDGTATVAADVERTRSLATAIDSTATIAANIKKTINLTTAIDGTATVIADVERARSLATAIDGTATVAADVERTRSLATVIDGTATVAADLILTGVIEQLATDLNSTALVTADVERTRNILAAINCTANIGADLTLEITSAPMLIRTYSLLRC